MSEDNFRREVLDRLISIEENQKLLAQEHPMYKKTINKHSVEIAESKASTKSAHHRITDMGNRIYATVGISATFVGVFASVLTWALGR